MFVYGFLVDESHKRRSYIDELFYIDELSYIDELFFIKF